MEKDLYKEGILRCKKLVSKATEKIDLDVVPEEYLCDDFVRPERIMTDLYFAVVWLINRTEENSKKLESMEKHLEKLQTEFEHLGHHVVASESNLRILRETLTYGEEKELPAVEKCHLAGGEVGKEN